MGQEVFNDLYFEAQFDKLKLHDPELVCPTGGKIDKMCTNPNCKSSFLCTKKQCSTCIKMHKTCSFAKMSALTDLLNERVGRYKDFMLNVFEVDNLLMEELQKFKKDMIKKYENQYLKESYKNLIEEVYKKKNRGYLSGSDAKQLLADLEKENNRTKWSTQLIEKYQTEMRKVIDQAIALKNQYFQPFINEIVLSSHVLWKEEKGKFQYLMQALDRPKKMDLIYRASQHYFSAGAFHHKCDNVEDTLVLIKTQYGKIIAGFSHYPWTSDSKGSFVNDVNKRAFLISLDLKAKMVPEGNGDKLIHCKEDYGPAFGVGDLVISDQCNKNRNSYSNFPTTYRRPGEKCQKNQDSIRAFVGSPKGNQFKVIEYEVFKVTFK